MGAGAEDDEDGSVHRFRADVEGLRAIAVGIVIAFHAGITRLAGGFVGVDVFFVISGFLITGLILSELRQTGRLGIAAFYSRRFRRILPAASLVLIATVALTTVALSPIDRSDFAVDALFSALFSMNIREIATNSDYLRDPATSPFLHYWSLAVEEQFYFVWPLLIVGLTALARRRASAPERVLAVGIGVVGAASFALCLWLTAAHPVWGFHLLPSRAWELAAGGAVALAVPTLARLPQVAAAVIGWLGLVAIGLSALLFDERLAFPGWRAAIPVLGTVAVIAAGCARPRWGPEAVLRIRPLQVIGKLSFSLYLWHWPILVVLEDERRSRALPILVVALAVLCPLTYALVENPIRRAPRLAAPPWRGVALGAGLTAAVVVAIPLLSPPATLDAGRPAPPPVVTIGDEVTAPDGPPPVAEYVPSDLVPALADAEDSLPSLNGDGCLTSTRLDRSGPCVDGDPDGSETIVLFGDSHAFHWRPALREIALREGWRLEVLTKAACPAAEVTVRRLDRWYTSCDRWRQATLERIAEIEPRAVFIGNSLHRRFRGVGGGAESEAAWAAGLTQTIGALPASAAVVLLGPSPRMELNVPRCLAENLEDPARCEEPAGRVVLSERVELERGVASDTGAAFVDTSALLCTRDPCPVIAWNVLIYTDENHLSAPIVRSLVPELDSALEEASAR